MKKLSFVFALLLAACGGKDEATPEQKAKLKEVTQSASQVVSAGHSAGQRRSGRNQSSVSDVPNQTPSDSPEYSSSQLTSEMAEMDCKFDMSIPKMESQSFSMKIDGPNCPMVMEIGATKQSQNKGTVRFYFELKSEELKALADVTRFELAGPVEGTGKNAGKAELKGSLHSKKHGEVGLEANISGDENGMTQEGTFNFSDFSITLKMEVNGRDVKYYINDKESSAEEIQELLGGGSSVPGMKAIW